ncbi:MAG: hypothetical protein WD737_12550 [Gemmatimonadota bacterium]
MSRRGAKRADRRSPRGVVSVGLWLVLLLAALSFVTWRQARGVQMERALRQVETDRGIAEAERVAAVRRVEELRSRVRIMRVARDRLGMRLPTDREIVFLPVGSP